MREKLIPYLLAGTISFTGVGLIAVAESFNDDGNQDCGRITVGIGPDGEKITQCSNYDAYNKYGAAQNIGGAGIVTGLTGGMLLLRLAVGDIRNLRRRPLSE